MILIQHFLGPIQVLFDTRFPAPRGAKQSNQGNSVQRSPPKLIGGMWLELPEFRSGLLPSFVRKLEFP